MDHDEALQHRVDVVVGLAAGVLQLAGGVTRRVGAVLEPVAPAALRPPGLPGQLQPAQWLEAWGREGRVRRADLRVALAGLLDTLVPAVLTEVLRRADLTGLVLRHVEIDAIVETVDLDAAAARLDVDAVAERLDLDAVVARLDLTSIVLERVDLDLVVAAVLDRIDLIGLAAEVIDGVDLPEIIRESTGSMASDTVQGARLQAITADEALGRAVDRLLLRRRARSTEVPAAGGPSAGQAPIPAQRDHQHGG